MMKRLRRPVQMLQHEPKWQPMANATLGAEREAQMLEADPQYVGTFKNHLYQVLMREYPYEPGNTSRMISWLIIRRIDSEAVRDWRHFQRIKNELCGPEREGFEMYPAESRLVDTSNQYSLFVLPDGVQFPFGWMERDVSDTPYGKNRNRPFAQPPLDLNAKLKDRQTHTCVNDREKSEDA